MMHDHRSKSDSGRGELLTTAMLRNLIVGPESPVALNLPIALTIVRMLLAPLVVAVLLLEFDARGVLGLPRELIAAVIFALASMTDWLDGYMARRRRQVTSLGEVLDPVADKVLTIAAFASLVQLGVAPAWMVALIVGREFAITGLRSVAHRKGLTIPASGWGKTKMVSQVAAILLLILGSGPVPFVGWAGMAMLWVVVITAMLSALDYFLRYHHLLDTRSAPAGLTETRRAT